MINFLISFIIFTFVYPNSIIGIAGNIQEFSSVNAGSFINNNSRGINEDQKALYSLTFIRYIANIHFEEIFFQRSFDKYIFSTNLSILNYGTLEDVNHNEFSANEQLIELSIFDIESKSFTYGISIGYIFSHIAHYRSSLINYNFGCSKSLINGYLNIGLSLENYRNVIHNYSNIKDSHTPSKRLSVSLNPPFIPINILVDYLYEDINNSEYIFSIQGTINNNFYFYSGKHFYLIEENTSPTNYNLLDNTGFGIGLLINNQYKIDFGMQSIARGVFSFGTSFSCIIK